MCVVMILTLEIVTASSRELFSSLLAPGSVPRGALAAQGQPLAAPARALLKSEREVSKGELEGKGSRCGLGKIFIEHCIHNHRPALKMGNT